MTDGRREEWLARNEQLAGEGLRLLALARATEDRDPDVDLDAFPTTPPTADERILPDGRVVPAE